MIFMWTNITTKVPHKKKAEESDSKIGKCCSFGCEDGGRWVKKCRQHVEPRKGYKTDFLLQPLERKNTTNILALDF